MLRHIAKNIVANNLAKKCEIQISYAIGIEKPLSVYINTFGTNKISEEEILKRIESKFDLTPKRYNKLFETKRTNLCKNYELRTLWETIFNMGKNNKNIIKSQKNKINHII